MMGHSIWFGPTSPTRSRPLYRNNSDGTFTDVSLRTGLGVNTRYLGFGVGLIDYDNDGWKDLFIANGHVYSQLATRNLHVTYKQPALLYRNLGGSRFEDVSDARRAGSAHAASWTWLRVR